MRLSVFVPLVALLALMSACAPRTASLPPPGVAHFPEYVEPRVPADAATATATAAVTRAWQFLQAGDLRNAERETSAALRGQPGFYPAQTVMAYLALARKDPRSALAQFTRVTDAHPAYASALVGRGLALVAGGDEVAALDAFRAGLAADPSLLDVARRIDVLTLRGLQEQLAAAREAATNGQMDAATRAYRKAIAASPDSAFLYREVAAIEQRQGLATQAIEDLRKANVLDPGDAASFAMLGDLLDAQGDLDGALEAYGRSIGLDGDPAVEARRAALRQRRERAALPEQYRAIDASAQVTRADLAALIGVRLAPLLRAAQVRDVGVITDIRGHWAEQWMAPVARAGIIEALPNHTFQPRTAIRRVDLAQAVSRLLGLIAAAQPGRTQTWTGARGRFSDMTAGHLAYPAASVAVASGVMQVSPEGAFQPTRVVTGAEAVAAIDRVRALADLPEGASAERR
jgi:tetratricopeptide (TPR) repeat protein